MSEHGKLLLARMCQWMLYGGSLGVVFAIAFPGPLAAAAFVAVMLSVLAMTFSPFLLTCAGCGASYFDIIPRLSEGMVGQWKKNLGMWKLVPLHCQSCGMDRS